MKVSALPNKEYKIITKMLTKIRTIHEQSENVNKEIRNIRKFHTKITELKNMITALKNLIEAFNIRLDQAEERTNKLKDMIEDSSNQRS